MIKIISRGVLGASGLSFRQFELNHLMAYTYSLGGRSGAKPSPT